jgi:hypothetical protein
MCGLKRFSIDNTEVPAVQTIGSGQRWPTAGEWRSASISLEVGGNLLRGGRMSWIAYVIAAVIIVVAAWFTFRTVPRDANRR